jgi:hypothetical protein
MSESNTLEEARDTLLAYVSVQLVFLLFRLVGLDDLELLLLDHPSHSVNNFPLDNRNKTEVPGLILERTWLMKPSSNLVLSTHAPYSSACSMFSSASFYRTSKNRITLLPDIRPKELDTRCQTTN